MNNISNSSIRRHQFLLIDILIFLLSPTLALLIRLDGQLDNVLYLQGLLIVTPLFLVIKVSTLYSSGFYRRYWQYASIDELAQVGMLAAMVILIDSIVFILVIEPFASFSLPRSLPLMDGVISFILVGLCRFKVRTTDRFKQQSLMQNQLKRVLVIGAGSAGVSLVKSIQSNPALNLQPVAFIDDDPQKRGLKILGIPVVGDRYDIPAIVLSLHIEKIVIAMPTASGAVIREVLEIAKETGIPASTLPGIHEILNGRVKASSIRDINIEDLLRRAPIQTDTFKVRQFLRGKRVLVTGGGGSIGSELCRQILKCYPSEILLLGKGENSVFVIQQELEQLVNALQETEQAQAILPKVSVFIADIRSQSRLSHAFAQFRPEVIFHAAAHKHVPLMELHAPEAITSNVMGTKNLLDLSQKYGVEHFVMVSTDKAVNPTNVMGASKRVAEMLVLKTAQELGKSYVVVRFGNVLGSRGSVVPTFQRQIATGGPITITHPDICRYFMTIPEAVQLVLQATVLGRGGEVMMLNMGQPVKIADLAKDLIRLSGYEPDKDIEIKFTGLRPGEKLFEELFIEGEEYEQTQHDKIFIVRNANKVIPDSLDLALDDLQEAALFNNPLSILSTLERLVPGYKPDYSRHRASSKFLESTLDKESDVIQNPTAALMSKTSKF